MHVVTHTHARTHLKRQATRRKKQQKEQQRRERRNNKKQTFQNSLSLCSAKFNQIET